MVLYNYLALVGFVIGVVMNLSCEHMTDRQVFNRWVDPEDPCFQNIFQDPKISDLTNNLNDGYIAEFNRLLDKPNKQAFLTKSITDFFCLEKEEDEAGYAYSFSLSDEIKNRLNKTYSYLDGDVYKFVKYMKKYGFANRWINKVESDTDFLPVLNKYRYFSNLLFALPDKSISHQNLFCVANNFFEFCFYPNTWPKFKKILKKDEDYPLARMIYSIMWYNLAGRGWKDWSGSVLNSLQKHANDGKTVVYIAGGTDIYQLLKCGIYNIKVIDPVLPSQPDYYSDIWEWFVNGDGQDGCLGDTIKFDFDNKKIFMERVEFEELGAFETTLSTSQKAEIPQTTTDWLVYDEMKNELGHVVFERRFCEQDDFVKKNNEVLLLSFNELYFIASNDEEDSWGIDISKFDNSLDVYVKQLRHPVNKQILCNMQKADNSYFSFIKLGSNIN